MVQVAMVGLFEVGDGGVRLVGTTRDPGAIKVVQRSVGPAPLGVPKAESPAGRERRLQLAPRARVVRPPSVDGVDGVDERAAPLSDVGSER